RGEVRDGLRQGVDRRRVLGRRDILVPARLGQVGPQVRRLGADLADEALVPGQRGEALRRERTQQGDRVAVHLAPQDRVDPGEEVTRGRVPGPAQVVRQLVQIGELGGQDGADGESTDGSHEARGYVVRDGVSNDPASAYSRFERCRRSTA